MDQENQPQVLANKVIRQLVQHMVSTQLEPSWDDYTSIRVVFRRCGGSWARLMEGDLDTVELLKTIVTAWGQMPKRQLEIKRVI